MKEKKRSLKSYSKETLVRYLEEIVSVYYHHVPYFDLLDVYEEGANSHRFWKSIDSINKRIDALNKQPHTRNVSRQLNRLYKRHETLCKGHNKFTQRMNKKNAES